MIDTVTGDCSNKLCLPALVSDPKELNKELNHVIQELIQRHAKK